MINFFLNSPTKFYPLLSKALFFVSSVLFSLAYFNLLATEEKLNSDPGKPVSYPFANQVNLSDIDQAKETNKKPLDKRGFCFYFFDSLSYW